jgi:hypothetical protein
MAGKPIDSEFVRWSLDARSAIQNASLNLINCYALPGLQGGDRAKRFGRLTGVAFSLWRAAFLAGLERQPYVNNQPSSEPEASQAEHAQELLRALLETNTVSFSVDQKTRYWMGHYYIHNAAYRLDEYVRKWPDCDDPHAVQRFKAFWIGSQIPPDYLSSARGWMLIFKPFSSLVDALLHEMGIAQVTVVVSPEANAYMFKDHPATLDSFYETDLDSSAR